MSEQNTVNHFHVADGKDDINIKINGELIIHIPEKGYKSLGMTFDQAKEFTKSLAQLLLAYANSQPASAKESK